jgi:methyl-accepting chemotaxis protein
MNRFLRMSGQQAWMDWLLVGVVWAQLALASYLATQTHMNTWWLVAFGGGGLALACTFLAWRASGRLVTRCVIATAFVSLTALHVQQTFGKEMHHGILVLMSFLLCYRDWRPIALAGTLAIAHQAGFHLLEPHGLGIVMYLDTEWRKPLMQIAYIAAEAGMLIAIARILGHERQQAAEVAQMVRALTASKQTLDLSISHHRAGSDLGRRLADAMAIVERTIRDLTVVAGGVKDASREISLGNTDLSSRTEEQAASLAKTAATVDELTETVRTNSSAAQRASQLAGDASDVAVKGGALVGEVVSTMNEIHSSARRIVDIIGVIDGIAFQTNILALNAAVEAARAGEQGRGFAVVAGEVRTLAQRSAQAAKEIKLLIDDSVHKVDSGAQLVGGAGKTMQDVVEAIQGVANIVRDIASGSSHQSAGIAEVNAAVTQLDAVTQQNAALVEEAAAAAESLDQQADALIRAMAVFKLSGEAVSTESAQAAEAPRRMRGAPMRQAA